MATPWNWRPCSGEQFEHVWDWPWSVQPFAGLTGVSNAHGTPASNRATGLSRRSWIISSSTLSLLQLTRNVPSLRHASTSLPPRDGPLLRFRPPADCVHIINNHIVLYIVIISYHTEYWLWTQTNKMIWFDVETQESKHCNEAYLTIWFGLLLIFCVNL